MLNIITIIVISVDVQMGNISTALYTHPEIFPTHLIIVETTLLNISPFDLIRKITKTLYTCKTIMILHSVKVRESKDIVYFGT